MQQNDTKQIRNRWWILLYLVLWVLLDQSLLKAGWSEIRVWFTRLALLSLTSVLIFKNHRAFAIMWNQNGSGFNLAIWRILFFGSFLFTGLFFSIEHIKIALFSMTHMPDSARVPLPLWGSLTYLIPVSEKLSTIAFYIMIISCVTSFIGFQTRWSVLLFSLSSFYVFGVTQLFGKVNHNHYFVWFPAILAFSGCGDVLSVDCLIKTRSVKALFESHSGKKYGRAFAATWLLIGIIYFFPGFQKIWESGLDWVLSDNLSNIIHHKLLELPTWKQTIAVQNYPLLCKSLAVLTLLFEIGFIFLILQSKYRWIAVVAGILFHVGTWIVLNIFFQFMIIAYFSFINWEKLLKRNSLPLQTEEQFKMNKSLNGIAIFLLVTNIYCGLLNIHSWPVSCFPTFSAMPGNKTEVLEFVELSKENTLTIIPLEKFHESFPMERFRSLELGAIRLYKENKMDEFKDLIQSFINNLPKKNRIAIYLVNISWENGKTLRNKEQTPLLYLN